MPNKTLLSRSIRAALGLTAVLAANAGAQTQETLDSLEEIFVTGTNIKGLDLEGAVQAVQINRDDIVASGANSLSDLFDEISITGGGTGTFTTEGSGPLSGQSPVGASGISLRGLGTSSTLTLVNGRRVSVSSFAKGSESFVDTNSIPLAAIERVEILPSGASALYGADAVAGVVNLILREDFDGFEVDVNYGDSWADSDDGRFNINAVWGHSTDNTNTLVVVDYYKRNATYERDREETAVTKRLSPDGIYPSFNDGYWMGPHPVFGGLGDAIESACATPASGEYGSYCGVNQNDFYSAEGELEALGATAQFSVDLSNGVTWFNELMVQDNHSNGVSSPKPFNLPVSAFHPGWGQDADLTAGILASADDGGFGSSPSDTVTDLILSAGDDVMTAYGAFPDPRAIEVDTQSYRFVSGLRGEIKDWSWETALSYGNSQSTQNATEGFYVRELVTNALLGNLCTDGSLVDQYDVNIINREYTYTGNGSCEDGGKSTLWYNPFGGQADQQVDADFFRTRATRKGESELTTFDAKISGTLFSLPAGAVSAAFGAEYREESAQDTPSANALATDTNDDPVLGFSATEVQYDRELFAAFAEFYVPITENFEVQLAARFDDYSDFGSSTNPKVGLRYQPIDELTFRANWSTSFRAPSLAQAGQGTTLIAYTAYCDENPEFSNTDYGDGDFCGGQTKTGTLNAEVVANAELQPETAETWSAGVLLRPNDNIEINIDYWSIDYQDLVKLDEDDYILQTLNGTSAGQVVVSDDFSALATGTPGLLIDPSGELLDAHFQLINAGYQKTDGVDLAYTQYFDTDAGSFTLTWDASYLSNFEEQISDSSVIENWAGEFRFPRLKSTAALAWRNDGWRARLSANYVHGYRDELADVRSEVLDNYGLTKDDEVNIPSVMLWNGNLGYVFSNDSYLQLSVKNLLDKRAPDVFGSSSNVDYSNHSIMGRFATLRYNYVF
ncbi:TonB-dependent receptor [Simiduia curdlanivorans]|uniref:TonB-dependent receptor plug domain-containing protein n=1 Tax=Simiduia curdlanivorans TaxID=1492769 RepID=A0ABV8V3Q4_9GAMM|nr:TonB-dependent receptor [Simiduia curdlanivorans]MDN3638230.1 TonB-dependent receptor [Simiduia curdlanivorans]